MSGTERFDVVVVGSGAGGGLVAGELADAGASVLLVEAGPHRTAADFTRWEAHANHDIWFAPTLVEPRSDGAPPLAVIRGRCVGGTSTVNTKVALRPSDEDYAKWHAAAGLVGEGGEPFGAADMAAHFARVEARLGVRERSDWQTCIHTVAPGFQAMGAELEPVMSYTDANCMRCGSCLQGCPTNAGKNSMNVYIHPPWAEGRLALRAECTVTRVVIEDRGSGPEATGVEYIDAAGQATPSRPAWSSWPPGRWPARTCCCARASARPPAARPARSSSGATSGGIRPGSSRGLFEEPQDAHRVYPISAHCMTFQSDANGGFIVEAATIQDPIGFSIMLCDEDGAPMWGRRLSEIVRRYRYFSGLLAMVTDQNNGVAWIDEDGRDRYSYAFNDVERERDEASSRFAREALLAAGAKRVLPSSQCSTHVQGGCRMGSDPERSVVDAHAESHDVRRLFVGDSSVIPTTISVNPSLTIMSLASRLAAYLAGGEHGYFEAGGRVSIPAT